MNAIEVKALKKIYSNGVEALSGVDLTVKEGDFFALLGANGAGKTTLIGTLVGLVNRSSGSAEVFGKDVAEFPEFTKYSIGLVPQEFNFSIFEKVEDIVATQAGYFGVPRAEALKETEVLLNELGLWEKRHMASRTLSGGMKRRLMIARALVHKPRLLILDEPTAGVDVELRHGMWEYLRGLNKNGTTILLTTHYLEEAEQLCKNVAIIKKGAIVKQGSVRSLLEGLDQAAYVVTLNKAVEALELPGFPVAKTAESHLWEVSLGRDRSLTQLVDALSAQGLTVLDLAPKGNRLEQLYLNLSS